MKSSVFIIFILFFCLLQLNDEAAVIQSGETITIKKPAGENLYLAAETINIEAVVAGDLIAAGKTVFVGDTVYDDVILAGSDIQINSYIDNDARLFGETVRILKSVNGDLIIFGGVVYIDKHVVIAGDLLVFCREAIVNGTVNGDMQLTGNQITFNGIAYGHASLKAEELHVNGTINGKATLAAAVITLHQNARFHNDIEYWQEENSIDFSPYITDEMVSYNDMLKAGIGSSNWNCFGIGSYTFWTLYSLTILFTITMLVLLFHSSLGRAGVRINESYMKNFGFGALYFIGFPLATLFLIIIVIGIPLALLLGTIYFLSIIFAFTISSVILAEGINYRYNKEWGKSRIILVAAVIFVILKVTAAIPFIGMLAVMILIGMVYGTLMYLILPKLKIPYISKQMVHGE